MLFCQSAENVIFWLHMSYLFCILVPLDVTSKVKFETELSRFYGCYTHSSALSLFLPLSYLKTQQQTALLRTPSIFLSIPPSKSSPRLRPGGLLKGNIPRKCLPLYFWRCCYFEVWSHNSRCQFLLAMAVGGRSSGWSLFVYNGRRNRALPENKDIS